MQTPAENNRLLTPDEVAQVLALPRSQVETLTSRGTLTSAFKLTREPRYLREDVERLTACCSSGTHHHAVQFFEDEQFLRKIVADFLSEGFRSEAPMIVIARPHRLELFVSRLEQEGHGVKAALETGQLTLLDAHETLARFMVGGMPDARRFRSLVGPLIEQKHHQFRRARLRAYGEMVDILWGQGQPDAAVRLEELWNELSEAHPFSLLCAYSMSNFATAESAERFTRVCDTHSVVVPTEASPEADSQDSLKREIASLQQTVAALKAELQAYRQAAHLPRRAEAA